MKTETITENASSHPVSCDSGYSAYSIADIENACTDSSSTTYATINLTRGTGATTTVYFSFNFNIPTTATINSVACTAKCYISNRTNANINIRQIRLYSGSTAKGTASTVGNSTSEFAITTGDVSTWTAANVNNAKIRLYAKRGAQNVDTNYYFRFYGATFTVNYTYEQTIYEVTSQSDVTGVSMSPSSADIVAGGVRTFEILGDLTNVIVEDNSVDVTSQLVEENHGSVSATYTLSNVSEDHFVYFYCVHGNKIFVKVNGTWVESQDVKVKDNSTWQSVSKAYKHDNGSWVEQSDKSAMFDSNALYLKG